MLKQPQESGRGQLRAKLRAFPLMTLVCVLLLAPLAFVQVAHVHSVETTADQVAAFKADLQSTADNLAAIATANQPAPAVS